MWHPVRGEALLSVSSIYKPHHHRRRHPSFSLCLCGDSLLKISSPLFKNHFCVYPLCLPLSLPSLPSSSLPLSVCLSLSLPASLCVVLISDRHCSRSQRGTETAAQNSEAKRLKKKKENTLVNTTPDIPLFFLFDVFHLISLTSHLPLTKKTTPSIQRVSSPRLSADFSSCFSFLFFFFLFFFWVATSNAQPNQEGGRISPH